MRLGRGSTTGSAGLLSPKYLQTDRPADALSLFKHNETRHLIKYNFAVKKMYFIQSQ
jgi:hypothetical protein